MLSALVSRVAPDVVISADTPSQVQARLVRQCRRAGIGFVSWVQDLYGLAAYEILSRKLPVIGAAVGRHYMRLDRRCLRDSDAVVLITDAFREMTQLWGVEDGLTTVTPNWAAIDELPPCPKDNDWSRRHGLHDKLCLVYSGTLAMKHNPDLLLQLALEFADRPDVRVVVVSEGAGAEWLKDAAPQQAASNLIVLPFQPFETLPQVLGSADVLVSILEPEAGRFSVPSKVLTYLCASRPVLLGVPPANLAARTVLAAGAGLVAPPTDPPAFVRAARQLLDDPPMRLRMGQSGRRYAEQNFEIAGITERFSRILGSVRKAA
jgi:glycosyltransferase involved in cell wall biosynthesis